jgi:hypothetical protein
METEIKKSSEKKNDKARPKWGGVTLKHPHDFLLFNRFIREVA